MVLPPLGGPTGRGLPGNAPLSWRVDYLTYHLGLSGLLDALRVRRWEMDDPLRARRLVREHRSGDWPQMTAVKCGIHPYSLASYVKKGLEEGAVEPYKTFAAEFLKVEAEFSQRLLDVILDAALGRRPVIRLDENGHPLPRPSVAEARWLLQTRFRVLWGGGGVSAIAMFSTADDPARRQKALEVLASLSPEQKEQARQAGFVIGAHVHEEKVYSVQLVSTEFAEKAPIVALFEGDEPANGCESRPRSALATYTLDEDAGWFHIKTVAVRSLHRLDVTLAGEAEAAAAEHEIHVDWSSTRWDALRGDDAGLK